MVSHTSKAMIELAVNNGDGNGCAIDERNTVPHDTGVFVWFWSIHGQLGIIALHYFVGQS